jgi:hypothetical protein
LTQYRFSEIMINVFGSVQDAASDGTVGSESQFVSGSVQKVLFEVLNVFLGMREASAAAMDA